jgi:hypothetical protein
MSDKTSPTRLSGLQEKEKEIKTPLVMMTQPA